MRDKFLRGYAIGILFGNLIGIFVTQAYWGVGLFD